MFVIARISVQNTNLYSKVGRSGTGAKLNVIKSKIEEKIKIDNNSINFLTLV